ncbi:MAG TPA: phytanoyl-CoA dioxygenase family protein [Pyrinomonadaceae bacterium]|jgi:ectoine hydroxylase-related dioxygenase (phytanoyl-CoA dioxygenase family)
MNGTLSPEQVRRYEQDGILFPVRVLTPGEAAKFRADFERLEARLARKLEYAAWLHLYFRWAYGLATHPAVLRAVEKILGPDILVHGTLVLCKHPHDPAYVSWHQDGTYTNQQATPSTSAWIALSDSTTENGCMRVIAGSHLHGALPHTETFAAHNLLSRGQEVSFALDERRVRDVTLSAGEMSLHQQHIIHSSEPNRSDTKRIGFIVRFATPQLAHSVDPVIRVGGRDECAHLPLLAEPPEGDGDEGAAAWHEYQQRRRQQAVK